MHGWLELIEFHENKDKAKWLILYNLHIKRMIDTCQNLCGYVFLGIYVCFYFFKNQNINFIETNCRFSVIEKNENFETILTVSSRKRKY